MACTACKDTLALPDTLGEPESDAVALAAPADAVEDAVGVGVLLRVRLLLPLSDACVPVDEDVTEGVPVCDAAGVPVPVLDGCTKLGLAVALPEAVPDRLGLIELVPLGVPLLDGVTLVLVVPEDEAVPDAEGVWVADGAAVAIEPVADTVPLPEGVPVPEAVWVREAVPLAELVAVPLPVPVPEPVPDVDGVTLVEGVAVDEPV